MLTIEDLQKKLINMNLSKVSIDSGINYMIIYRINKGIKSVSYEGVKALSDYFKGLDDANA
jgi:hypothetical protein